MDALKKTMFILALVSVTGYSIRHMYLKWFDPHTSVLDKYDKPITSEIKKANSLQQLERLYAEAHQKVVNYEAMDSIKKVEYFKKTQLLPYSEESELRQAIVDWEAKTREIFQIRFYWSVGLVLILIGGILYQKTNQWLGITVLIIGFGEMVYWTSPTFFGSGMEYENLLNNKMVLSVFTLGLLIAAGFLTGTVKTKSK